MRRSMLSSLSLLALCAAAPESSGGATTPAAPAPGKTRITVASRLEGGHRRAGLAIPAASSELEVTAEQLKKLQADPNVVIASPAIADAVEAGEPARLRAEHRRELEMAQRQITAAERRADSLEAENKRLAQDLEASEKCIKDLEAEKGALERQLAEANKPAKPEGKGKGDSK